MVKRHPQLTLALLRAADLLVAAVAWGAGYVLRIVGGRIGLTSLAMPPFHELVPAMIFSLMLAALVFGRFGLDEPRRTKGLTGELADLARAVVTVWALTWVFTTFLRHVTISRLMMLSVLAAWLLLGGAGRIVARGLLRRLRGRNWNVRYAAIVGTGRLAQTLFHCLKRNRWTGIEPVYFIGGDPAQGPLLGLDILGPHESIETVLAARPVDIVFVALATRDHERTKQVLDRLTATDLDVRVVPDLMAFYFLKHDLSQLDELPIINLTYTPLAGWNAALKRCFDVAVSGAAMLVLAAPLLLIGLLVKRTSRGPVFYRQVRASLGGRPFRIIKFRTMQVDAEATGGPAWGSTDDPRATRLGRLLRISGLDELPQLLNVFLGDMSLVGPRPERPELIDRFRRQVPRYVLRHHAKAGLTGWAQVHGLRGRTSLRKRVQYDLFYICHWSFALDLWIILLTAVRLFFPARPAGRDATAPP